MGMKTFSAAPLPDREPTDAEVISAVLAGDRSQFALLVRRHNQTMFRACRAVLRNDQDAEDAVQSAWINVFRALPSFRADAAFRTWATRIAVNEASTRLRSHRRFAEVPKELIMDESASPDETTYAHEVGRVLEREIDALPEGLRTVLVLRDVVELDTAETASALGIEEENVRVRLHRARQALSQRLASSEDLAGVWRFDGDRCARVLRHVMAKIETI